MRSPTTTVSSTGYQTRMVLLSPLTTQEAVLSARIEGTQATLTEVLRFEAGEDIAQTEGRRQDIQEILNYRRGLREAERELENRPFSLNLLKRLHAVLLDSVRGRDRGRGRMLLPLFLYERRIISRPVFYLSGYLEENRDEYAAALRELNGLESWNRWVHLFLEAVRAQAEANATTAIAIMELYDRLKQEVLELTRSQYAVPLLDHLFADPVVTSSDLVGAPGMPSKQMVMTLLRKLREAGILKVMRESRGRRAQVLALAELISLCEGEEVL